MMPRDEPELVEMLRSKMIAEGWCFAKKITINEITQSDGRIYISIGSNQNAEMLVGSHLLIAAGRSPNVKNLGLENADVTFTPKGIQVNARLQSTNRKVYAIGDAAGSYQFTHIANYHAVFLSAI